MLNSYAKNNVQYIYIFISSFILKSEFYMNTINIQRTVRNETYI